MKRREIKQCADDVEEEEEEEALNPFFIWKYKYENKNGSLNNVHFIITVVEASKVVQLLLFIFFYIIYLLIIVWIKLNLQNNCCQINLVE